MTESPHIPVMLTEVLENLRPHDGGVYIDGTFGNGGYTSAILDSADTRVISFDRDDTVLPRVKELQQKYGSRFQFFQDCFSNVLPTLRKNNIGPVDGLVLDIGVSVLFSKENFWLSQQRMATSCPMLEASAMKRLRQRLSENMINSA